MSRQHPSTTRPSDPDARLFGPQQPGIVVPGGITHMGRRKTPYPKNPPEAVEWLDRKAEWECQVIGTQPLYDGVDHVSVRGPEKRGNYSRLMIDLFWDTHPEMGDSSFTHKAFHCRPCPRCDDWSRTGRNCPDHPEQTVEDMFRRRLRGEWLPPVDAPGAAQQQLAGATFPAAPTGMVGVRMLAASVIAEARRSPHAGPHIEGRMMGLPVVVDRAAGRIHPGLGMLPEEWAQFVEGDPEHFASTPGTDRYIRERNAQRGRGQTTQIRAETDHGPAVVTYTREDG
jgi:hypothetical protein